MIHSTIISACPINSNYYIFHFYMLQYYLEYLASHKVVLHYAYIWNKH